MLEDLSQGQREHLAEAARDLLMGRLDYTEYEPATDRARLVVSATNRGSRPSPELVLFLAWIRGDDGAIYAAADDLFAKHQTPEGFKTRAELQEEIRLLRAKAVWGDEQAAKDAIARADAWPAMASAIWVGSGRRTPAQLAEELRSACESERLRRITTRGTGTEETTDARD